jgi:hypothetical protein
MSEQDNQGAEPIIADDELEIEPELDNTENVDDLREKLMAAEEAKRQILARAKKAEQELKGYKTPKPEATQKSELTTDDIDARVLKTTGMSDALLDDLRKVAKVTGKSLIDAQQDSIFIAMKATYEAEEKSSKAKLGASRSASTAKVEKNTKTPDLTDAEHRELWNSLNR